MRNCDSWPRGANANTTATRDFMPFGEELGVGVGTRTEALKYSYLGSDRVRQRFTGYLKDDETGLDFAEARMYQNKHGRFTAVDPLLTSASALNPQTFNRYIYTGNNPINYTDPSGLEWCQNADRTVAWSGGQGIACNDGQTDITGQTLRQSGYDGGLDSNGNAINRGDYTTFYEDGRAVVESHTQYAARTGTEVQGTQEQIITTNASELGGTISSRGSGVLPLPCMTGLSCGNGDPPPVDLTHGASADEVLDFVQTVADAVGLIPVLGEPADAISGIISAGRGDYAGAVLSACALNPFGGQACGAGKLGRRLGQVVDTVGNLRKAGRADAHHIIQDAAVKDLPGYNSNLAPGIQLPGEGRRGTPHYLANMVQRQKGGGTYAAERRIGYKALRRAGVEKVDARNAIEQADAYFRGIGVDGTTTTRIPRRSRR